MSSRRYYEDRNNSQPVEKTDYLGSNELDHNLIFATFAEFVGCLLITLFVSGSEEITSTVCIISGLIYALVTWIFRRVSGARFNPAITISLMLMTKIKIYRGLFYIGTQLLGSSAGSLILACATPYDPITGSFFHRNATLGLTLPSSEINDFQAMLIELIGSYLLMFIVLITMESRNETNAYSPLAVALVFMLGMSTIGQFTAWSLNPARSFGPALINNRWEHHWIYWVGPILGTILAALNYHCIVKYIDPYDDYEIEEEEVIIREPRR